MTVFEKLKILSDSAKYDVSCSSSGSNRQNIAGGLGNASVAGICHSWADDGRCISLLKVLLTNDCIYNCTYCVNKSSNDVPRAAFTPQELIDLTINFYKRNYIEGLFLSSAVYKNSNYTMELLLQVVKKLRNENNFNGYIHLKAIPGADLKLIHEAGLYADRMSVNIELPSNDSLKLLAPQKTKESIIKPMGYISSKLNEKSIEAKNKLIVSNRALTLTKPKPFVPAGQTTQLIVGATPEHDIKILKLSENLYKNFRLKRVYYSAYIPINKNPNLPAIDKPPLLREHRLYQADWLLRFYGFSADELLDENNPDFDENLDPKCDWALRNLHLFPVEINTADFEMILRIPGVGVKSALRIVKARRFASLDFEHLKKLGIVLKRAKYFITCKGKYYGKVDFDAGLIKNSILLPEIKSKNIYENSKWEQLSFFSAYPELPLLSSIKPSSNLELKTF